MITRGEIVRSLTGAWQIFLDRQDAMRWFDISVEGFWRSFQAILLMAPLYLVATLAERQIIAEAAAAAAVAPPDDTTFFTAKVVAILIDWGALPLLLALGARPLAITQRYAAFVVARNWSMVLMAVPYAAIAVLYGIDLIGMTLANILSAAVVIVLLRYQFLVIRHGLHATTGFALALVVFDFLLSLTIGPSVDQLFGI